MVDNKPLLVETPSEGVRLLRINRRHVRNAINLQVREALTDALRQASKSSKVRAVVVTGYEKCFAAGADIGEMKDTSPPEIYARNIEAFWEELRRFPKPLIAAVNGYALGAGFELALAADIVVAGENAIFGLPEIGLGIMPGGGGTQRFARLAGKHIALRLMLTADRFGGAEAKQYGVVSDLVADDNVIERALSIAGRITKMPPLAVMKIKEAVLNGLDAPLNVGLSLERHSYYFLNATQDKAEGVSAFLEKRDPHFSGR